MKNDIQSFMQIVKKYQHFLLLSHKRIDGDGLSSILLLFHYLQQLGKNVSYKSTPPLPSVYSFLPGFSNLEKHNSSHEYRIHFKNNTNIHTCHAEGGSIHIHSFTPIEHENIHLEKVTKDPEVIIVCDSSNLEHLGDMYNEDPSLFYRVPVINIDHHISNEEFGKVNLVDTTASCTTQVIYQILQEGMQEKFDAFLTPDMATLSLTGLIVDTGSFIHSNTSPKALQFAAELMDKGARQQEIIQKIFKTKPLSTLKIWGRILSHIEQEIEAKIVYSYVSHNDFRELHGSPEDAQGLIDEIMVNAPENDIVVLFKEYENNTVSVSLRSRVLGLSLLPIVESFGGGGHEQACGVTIQGKPLREVMDQILSKLRSFQGERYQTILPSKNVTLTRESRREGVDTNNAETPITDTSLQVQENNTIKKGLTPYSFSTSFQKNSTIPEEQEEYQETDEEIDEEIDEETISDEAETQETIEELEQTPKPKRKRKRKKKGIAKTSEMQTMEATTESPLSSDPSLEKETVITQDSSLSSRNERPIIQSNAIETIEETISDEAETQETIEETISDEAETQETIEETISDEAETQETIEDNIGDEMKNPQNESATSQNNTPENISTPPMQKQPSQEEALAYVQHFAQQLHTMDPSTKEYADLYQQYQYYVQFLGK